MTIITTECDNDGIFTIRLNDPNETMNIYNQQLIEEFEKIFQQVLETPSIKAVIIISDKPDCFIAGADINLLNTAKKAEDGAAISFKGHLLLNRIENCRKPFICAINGFCLGAGYELALACHYRIATSDHKTKIALPEVMLGLLPGGRGNTVLPRLIDLPTALDLLLTGKQLNGKRALRIGMIDEIVPNTILHDAARQSALRLIASGKPKRKRSLKTRALCFPPIAKLIINKARAQVMKKTMGNYPAPLAILDVISQGLSLPLADALKIETQKFGELSVSPEAKELINIYFSTTELKKETFLDHNVEPLPIKTLGILGGGLMGAGIATVSIEKANTNVRIKDINNKGIRASKHYVSEFYKKRIARRILSKEAAAKKMNTLSGSLDYQGFQQCDLIIEAVFENIDLKHQMIADIEQLENTNTLFASNTSSIPISNIAKQAKRPENIIGMHYFSPVEKMPLLEIIKHSKTSDQTLATAVDFGKKQGKTVIVVNDGAGFYVNRILAPYINAALQCGLDGVPFDKIDQALTQFGFPVGPIKLLDEVGLDVGSKVQPILEQSFGSRMESTPIQQTLMDKQRLGKKVKKGFYSYDKKSKGKHIDTSVYDDLNITPSNTLSSEKIIERCLYMMLNEAVYCLDDQTIFSERDGDIGAIFGIGFPPFRGGPFRYMNSLGIQNIVDTMQRLEANYGEQYAVAPRLIKMAKEGSTFYSL